MTYLRTWIFTALIIIFAVDSSWAECDAKTKQGTNKLESDLRRVNAQAKQKCAKTPENLAIVGYWINTCTRYRYEKHDCLNVPAAAGQNASDHHDPIGHQTNPIDGERYNPNDSANSGY